jgi:hypothetical protein
MEYPEVNVTKCVLMGGRSPQLGERLTHRADGVCHRVRLDGVVMGGNASITVSLGKDLENWDGIVELSKEGVNAVLETEFLPEKPMCLRCFGAFISNVSLDLFLHKAEISAERVSLRSWHSHQGIV